MVLISASVTLHSQLNTPFYAVLNTEVTRTSFSRQSLALVLIIK